MAESPSALIRLEFRLNWGVMIQSRRAQLKIFISAIAILLFIIIVVLAQDNFTINDSLVIVQDENTSNETIVDSILDNSTFENISGIESDVPEVINETNLSTEIIENNDPGEISVNEINISQEIVTEELNNQLIQDAQTFKLGKLRNEDQLDFDKDYKDKFLEERHNYSDLAFEKIEDSKTYELKIGAKKDSLRGFEINQGKYAVDLLTCNSYQRYCTFRVNGIPTKGIYVKNENQGRQDSFALDDQYSLTIESAELDFCDNKRFCHLGFEGYHIVNVKVGR